MNASLIPLAVKEMKGVLSLLEMLCESDSVLPMLEQMAPGLSPASRRNFRDQIHGLASSTQEALSAITDVNDWIDVAQTIQPILAFYEQISQVSAASASVLMRVVGRLAVRQFVCRFPILSALMDFCGFLVVRPVGTDPQLVVLEVDWSAIQTFWSSPEEYWRGRWQFLVQSPENFVSASFPVVRQILNEIGFETWGSNHRRVMEWKAGAFIFGLRVGAQARPEIVLSGRGVAQTQLQLGELYSLDTRLSGEFSWTIGPTESLNLRGACALTLAPALSSALTIGPDSGTRINIRYPTVKLEILPAEIVLDVSSGITVGGGTEEGVLASMTGGSSLSSDAEMRIRWSSLTGFKFEGGLKGEYKKILGNRGAISVSSVEVNYGTRSSGVYLRTGIGVSIQLGPVAVSIEGLGVCFEVGSATGTATNKPLNCTLAWPHGMSCSIDAGPVRGGGFIQYQSQAQRYVGGLSINVGGIQVRAFGVVDARAPGVSGYSFLIVISAEFTPVQLGMGFTLNGMGGLCGIQRSVSSAALQRGVRDGSLTPLLFARDPVRQASQLVTGLQTVFPPTRDRYVFGPMFKLGWGTPTVVTVDLGIVIQFPSPVVIALIGTISARFPDPDHAIVKINIDIAGTLDTGEKTLAIDASLRDSKIGTCDLAGDMALRLRWGDRPDFAFAIGGFHKAFKPPAGFPELRRLSLSLHGAIHRITLAAYFAITSNSLQLGARAELYAEALGFNVFGYVEFHALVIFDPFSFRIDFGAGLALRRGTSVIMSITVTGMLSGPGRWRVQGSASISILFFEISISFDAQFGEPAPQIQPEVIDLWERKLLPAVRDLRNWTAALPVETGRVVSLASGAATRPPDPRPDPWPPLRLDPLGTLSFRQKEVPLGRRITKFGEKRVAAPTTFNLHAAQIGTADARPSPVEDSFAPGQFQHLTDAEKLSRPSFERMDAGATFGAADVKAFAPDPITVSYQTVELWQETSPSSPTWYRPGEATLLAALDTAPLALAPLRTSGNQRFAPPPGAAPLVTLDDEQVVLVHATNLQPLGPGLVRPTASPGAAYDALQAQERTHPEVRGSVRVVPLHEAARSHSV